MINDATVEITCGGEGRLDFMVVELPFVYPDYSGKNGWYDHRPETVNRIVCAEGWTVDADDEDRHFCEDCARSEAKVRLPSRRSTYPSTSTTMSESG